MYLIHEMDSTVPRCKKEVIKLEVDFSKISVLYISINVALLILIWLVQVIIYPGMYGWVNNTFAELHRDYSRRISLIVGPLMLAQAVLALRQVIIEPQLAVVLQAVLIVSVWGVTAFISMPLHRRLRAGYDSRVINRLIKTNWLRTVGWSLVSLLDWRF
jgi:hypothetical protein